MSTLVRFHLPLALLRFPHCVRQEHAFWRMSWTHASTCPHVYVSSRLNFLCFSSLCLSSASLFSLSWCYGVQNEH